MKRALLKLLGLVAGLSVSFSLQAGSVVDTAHNLSATGTGAVRAATEEEICIFCHTSHSSTTVTQLWNRGVPAAVYQPYTSSTAVAQPGQPTGDSLLCLSCHDGTIAIGDVLSRATDITMAGGVTTMPAGDGLIGTDLTHDHPVSFNYTGTLATQNGELVDPGTLPPTVPLDAVGQMQCTSCHLSLIHI